jgi:hypothetical protein
VEHDHDVGVDLQGFFLQRFLIAAITLVLFVPDDMVDTQCAGFFHCIIPAGIIAEDYLIDDIAWDFSIRLGQGTGCIICREDDDDLFILIHSAKIDGML